MNNDERIIDIDTEETTKSDKKDSKKGKSGFHVSVYDMVSIVMSAFIIIAVVFTFVFRLVGVDGTSMTDTLQHGDWLLTVNKESYERGDIVVITEPNYFDEPLIKRVIAKGGETVDIDYTTSTVYVDGVALKEPYTREDFILQKFDDIGFPYSVIWKTVLCRKMCWFTAKKLNFRAMPVKISFRNSRWRASSTSTASISVTGSIRWIIPNGQSIIQTGRQSTL